MGFSCVDKTSHVGNIWGPSLVPKLAPRVFYRLPMCSPPFWDQYVIGIPLVQNCYVLIASWLTFNKSDGLKGAVRPVPYRVGAASLQPRCSVLYFELLYLLKLVHAKIQHYLLHGNWMIAGLSCPQRGVLTACGLIKDPPPACSVTDATTPFYWNGTVLGSQLLHIIKLLQ